ncbi:glucose-1-phosphate thymidylyltransferase homolog [Methanothermobacter sp. MT-2]|nr:glucose-1-phosphate thymidylyltransferase homolog [Methanothermobacter sp. MT-2]HHW04946.1 NTP transferase domain-containing protein [Methanothermobacter sp.]
MQAVILTAGEGTRMRPLTLTRPKTMLPVAGKPILQYNIEALRENGIKNLIMITGYHESKVKDYFGDGSRFNVNITYHTQTRQLGTADAIKYAREHVTDDFIVLNGDIITEPATIKDLLGYHEKNQADTTIILREVKDPSQFGVVKLEGDDIKDIIEKPPTGRVPSNLINTGIYLFNNKIFHYIKRTKPSPRGEYEITDSIKMQIKDGLTIKGIVSKRHWIDVGKPWELLEANEKLLKNMEEDIKGEIEDNVTIHGPITLEENSIIRSGTYIIGPVHIGKNCDIGPNCYIRANTSIGDNVSIGNAVEIKNSIIMDKTNINHLSYVGDSVIGENCNLGAGTNIANLRFDDNNVKMTIKEEKMDTGRRKLGVIFADNVKTGINSSFNPGIKIGPRSCIGPGSIISHDIPSDRLVITNQEHIIDKRK